MNVAWRVADDASAEPQRTFPERRGRVAMTPASNGGKKPAKVCAHDGYRSSYHSKREAWLKCCKCGKVLASRGV